MTVYATIAEVQSVAERLGLTWSGTDTEKEQAVARAQVYLDGMAWPGVKTNGRQQDSEWPRSGATDRDGWLIDSTAVPPEIVEACSLLAIVEAASPGLMSPSVTLNQIQKRVTVGPISVENAGGSSTFSARPIITRVVDVLSRIRPRSRFTLERA